MKNGFWHGMGKVFGDCVAPGMFSVTTGMAEGATVASESAAGEGRLNDEFAKHYVKQAKIEDKFPSYHDVSGAADVKPGGAPYYFNGAFHQWLQEKYGLSAYAEFWWRVVNGKNITISGAFKKSFGIKLKKLWAKFEEEYQVPEEAAAAANPVEAGLVEDFFEPEKASYSQMNNAGSQYASLSASTQRLVWLDTFGWRVFTANASNPHKYEYLFDLRGITSLGLSNDGRFLAAGYISENGVGDKARVKIYDFDRATFYTVKEKGIKEASVVKSGSDWYLVGQKYFDHHYSICLYKFLLGDDGLHLTGLQPVTEIKLDAEINPFAFTPLQDGTFAYLKKDHLNYSICISSVDGTVLKEYAFPEGTAVRSLSYTMNDDGADGTAGTFYFNYAQKGTMPRLGKLKLAANQFEFSEKDISGGVFEPVFWDEKIVYIGRFYRQHRLLCVNPEDLGTTPAITANYKTPAEQRSNPQSQASLPSKAYNPLPYHLRGIFIPLGTYQTEYFGPNLGYSSNYGGAYLGATYITSNPWSSGTTDLITLTGGWNALSNAFGTSLTINKGTATSLLQSKTELKSEFDSDGWKQGGGILTLSTGFRTGNISKVTVSNTAYALAGRQDKRFNLDENETIKIGMLAPEYDDLYFGLSDVITASFSTIRRAGPGRFENKGFATSLSYGVWYDKNLSNEKEEASVNSSVAAGAKICIPHLLPFESRYRFTYNFPATLSFKVLPSKSLYGYTLSSGDKLVKEAGRAVFDAKVETVLFSMDIQKAIPGITALYLNDFNFAGGYAGTGTAGSAAADGFQTAKLIDYFNAVGDGRGYYMDSIYIKSSLEFTPNIGLLASPNYKMNVFAIYSYTLHSVKKIRPEERTRIFLGLDMNF